MRVLLDTAAAARAGEMIPVVLRQLTATSVAADYVGGYAWGPAR